MHKLDDDCYHYFQMYPNCGWGDEMGRGMAKVQVELVREIGELVKWLKQQNTIIAIGSIYCSDITR